MIEYVKGDLFAESHPMIVHGCNAQGVMGSGVAKIIKEKFPVAFSEYNKYCLSFDSIDVLGTNNIVECGSTIIVNAITQRYYGKAENTRYVSYDAIDECLGDLANYIKYTEHGKLRTVQYMAMPKIGSGLGQGHWPTIESIINHRLENVKVRVYEL